MATYCFAPIVLCHILLALQVMDLDRRVRREQEQHSLDVEPALSPLPTNKSEQLFVLEDKLKNLLKQVDALGEIEKVDEAEPLNRKVLLFLPYSFVKHL